MSLTLTPRRDASAPIATRGDAAVADGLDAARAAGVRHRDLKPDSVFLVRDPDGSLLPKMLDFGIEKLSTEDMQHRPQ